LCEIHNNISESIFSMQIELMSFNDAKIYVYSTVGLLSSEIPGSRPRWLCYNTIRYEIPMCNVRSKSHD